MKQKLKKLKGGRGNWTKVQDFNISLSIMDRINEAEESTNKKKTWRTLYN